MRYPNVPLVKDGASTSFDPITFAINDGGMKFGIFFKLENSIGNSKFDLVLNPAILHVDSFFVRL